jgi:hypothetical protein
LPFPGECPRRLIGRVPPLLSVPVMKPRQLLHEFFSRLAVLTDKNLQLVFELPLTDMQNLTNPVKAPRFGLVREKPLDGILFPSFPFPPR